MSTSLQDRRAALLDEVLEIGMAAARELNAALPEAQTPQEKACLATALNRTLRGVRQTVALEARLVREAERAGREERTEARAEAQRRLEARRARVSAEVERVIWSEYEGDDAQDVAAELSDLLQVEVLAEAFLDEPLDTQVARICADLGISCSAHPREGRDSSRGASGAPGDSRRMGPRLRGDERGRGIAPRRNGPARRPVDLTAPPARLLLAAVRPTSLP